MKFTLEMWMTDKLVRQSQRVRYTIMFIATTDNNVCPLTVLIWSRKKHRVQWFSDISTLPGHSRWLLHEHGMPYRNSSGTRLFFLISVKNWRPFCSSRRTLMRSDNELCFIYTPVAQCCYVTMYWLLQTNSVNTVWWSCSSNNATLIIFLSTTTTTTTAATTPQKNHYTQSFHLSVLPSTIYVCLLWGHFGFFNSVIIR